MIQIDVEKIRDRVRQKIEDNGGNLNATAKEIGILQPVLFRFVNQGTIPKIDTLNKLFTYLYN